MIPVVRCHEFAPLLRQKLAATQERRSEQGGARHRQYSGAHIQVNGLSLARRQLARFVGPRFAPRAVRGRRDRAARALSDRVLPGEAAWSGRLSAHTRPTIAEPDEECRRRYGSRGTTPRLPTRRDDNPSGRVSELKTSSRRSARRPSRRIPTLAAGGDVNPRATGRLCATFKGYRRWIGALKF